MDGLRAVAVLLVVFSHLRTRVTGGYVGVDVFFVISGYLISGNILSEMTAGRFSIVSFYERRIRRIFPALLVMMFGVTLLAYRLLVPSEVVGYAKSLLAALFSVSNLLFWHDAGYFDAPSELKPLLHTWSLAVEEQFYLFFPIFLVLIRRYARNWLRTAVFAVTGVSFAAACAVAYVHADAAFFLLPLRAWELLAGTIVSQNYVPVLRSSWSRNVAAAGGLLLILVPSMVYTTQTVFPGLTALPPVLGAALIIAAGQTGPSWTGRLLAWKPVVFIGLISYSLYLWHWPLIVFQQTSSILFPERDMTSRSKLLLVLLAIVVATLSWALVEQPFRKGRFRPTRRGVFAINGCAVLLLTAAGIWMIGSHGWASRFSPAAQRVASYAAFDERKNYREGTCFLGPDDRFEDFQARHCLTAAEGRPAILIFGDSHGAQLWPGLSAVFGADHAVLQANASGCLPLLTAENLPSWSNCRRLHDFLFGDFLLHHTGQTVLLAGRWSEADLPALGRTIAWLQGRGIPAVLVGPGIEYKTPLPRVIASALRGNDPGRIATYRDLDPQALDVRMEALARNQWRVPYVSIYRDLCTPECPVYAAPDVPLLFDKDHMTVEGSTMLATAMRRKGELR